MNKAPQFLQTGWPYLVFGKMITGTTTKLRQLRNKDLFYEKRNRGDDLARVSLPRRGDVSATEYKVMDIIAVLHTWVLLDLS